jgi:very-short-patch-repair endonuclease/RecA/RadA recombinase
MNQFPLGKLEMKPQAVLGVFPQSDSSLLTDYETIIDNQEKFQLDKKLFEVQDNRERPLPSADQFYWVTPVDGSQEKVVLQAQMGASMKIEGPPGTGKSQVIVNILANALASGKKVLLVSQKRAALDVVFQRLMGVGLEDFAILVHDFRADRAAIYKKINARLENLEKYQAKEDVLAPFLQANQKLAASIQYFRSIAEAYQKKLSIGLSLYELYSQSVQTEDKLPGNLFPKWFDLSDLHQFQELMQKIKPFADLLQAEHPWFQRMSLHEAGMKEKNEIIGFLEGFTQELKDLKNQLHEVAYQGYFLMEITNLQEIIDDYIAINQELGNPFFAALYQDFSVLGSTFIKEAWIELSDICKNWHEIKIVKDLHWNKTSEMRAQIAVWRKYKSSFFRIFYSDFRNASHLLEAYLNPVGLALNEDSVQKIEKELDLLEKLPAKLEKLKSQGSISFADFPLVSAKTWTNDELQIAEKHLLRIQAFEDRRIFPTLKPKFSNKGLDSAHWNASLQYLSKLSMVRKIWDRKKERWQKLLHQRQLEPILQAVYSGEDFEKNIQILLQSFKNDFDDLSALDKLMVKLGPEERKLVMALVPEMNRPDFKAWFQNSAYNQWIIQYESAVPEATQVSSRQISVEMEQLSEYWRQHLTWASGAIKVLQRTHIEEFKSKNQTWETHWRDLSYQTQKKRNIWPIRKLLQQFWNKGISTLFPIWMVSPEAVSAIFDMNPDEFDLVIFDEASQCFTERAVPVILRAKQAIIVGDEKQLTPSNLYQVREDTENVDESIEVLQESESILQFASQKYVKAWLTWHYRSESDLLIHFSNQAFYESKLKMIPQAKEPDYHPVIHYQKVPGLWVNNRNEVEAKAVIERIEELIQREQMPSIGVVTFNFHQQQLILDEIDKRLRVLQKDNQTRMLELWNQCLGKMDGSEPVGLIVKNIENIQGDEREVMIFSFGYAPDAQGKLSVNFGLINQAGGSNRLNVAITRAKKQIFMIASIEPEQLHVENAVHEGPKLLKKYLQYCRLISEGQVSQALLVQKNQKSSSDISETWIDNLAKMLESKGLHIERNIGNTQYTIDLVVRTAKQNLAIECQGKVYFEAETDREREIYRLKLLQSRGWKTHRVWVRNFWHNPEKEVETILGLLG